MKSVFSLKSYEVATKQERWLMAWLRYVFSAVRSWKEKKDDFPVESIFLIFSQLNIGKLALLACYNCLLASTNQGRTDIQGTAFTWRFENELEVRNNAIKCKLIYDVQ